MRREAPIPTVVEVHHKGRGRSTVRWKVCWSDGSRSSLNHTSLDIALDWAAWEYLSRCLWEKGDVALAGPRYQEPTALPD
jgi:hypothetical protein